MDFRPNHIIETAEHIPIQIELSGLASRVFAFGIDLAAMLMLMGLVLSIFALPTFSHNIPELARTAVPLAMFCIFFGYHLIQEWLWNGKTIGKAALNIRVLRQNGQAIGFWEALGRNFLRVLDVYLLGIGLVCMLIRQDEKRFGDLLVGTIVVLEQPIARPSYTSNITSEHTPWPLASSLSAEETELLKTYQNRRTAWFSEAQKRVSDQLQTYFSERLQQAITTDTELDALLNHVQQAGK